MNPRLNPDSWFVHGRVNAAAPRNRPEMSAAAMTLRRTLVCRDSASCSSMCSHHARTSRLFFAICTLLLAGAFLIAFPAFPLSSLAIAEKVSPGFPKAPGAGDLYAVVVGVSRYREPKIPRLDNAEKDAEAFGEFLNSQNRIFKETRVVMLTNEKATKSEVEKQ